MTIIQIIAILITLTALFAYLNHRFIRLPTTIGVMRGGVSVAPALSLPPGRDRELILAVTWVIMLFSIMVQELTVKSVVLRCLRERPGAGDCRAREVSQGTADSGVS